MSRDQFLTGAEQLLAPHAQRGRAPRGQAWYWSVSIARGVHLSIDALEDGHIRVHMHTMKAAQKAQWRRIAADPIRLPAALAAFGPEVLDNGNELRAYLRFVWQAGTNNYRPETAVVRQAVEWLVQQL